MALIPITATTSPLNLSIQATFEAIRYGCLGKNIELNSMFHILLYQTIAPPFAVLC